MHATVLLPEAPPAERTVTQRFLTDGASIVRMGGRTSCRVFRAIDVRASRYTNPDGTPVDFLQVARSPAAGLWRIGAPGGDAHSLRIVLKYPVETLSLALAGRRVSLTEDLDSAGDSVTLRPSVQAWVEAAFADGQSLRLIGRSADTGRTVEDLLAPLDARDIAACDAVPAETLPATADDTAFAPPGGLLDALATEEDALVDAATLRILGFAPPTGPMPHHGPVRVFYDARLPGPPDPERILGCRMTDLGGEIERYRITRLEGFVSQSSEAWVTRDPVGEVRQVYIPGVFEAIRSPGTARWTASVSIAASANDPFEAPIYKGCLGARSIAMSGAPDDLAEVRERAPRFRGAEPFAPSRNATPIALPRAEPVRVSSGGGSSPNVTGFASSWLVATGDAPLEPQRGAPLPPLPNADGLPPLSPPLPPLSPPDITWTDDPPPGGGGDVPPLPDMPRPSTVPLPIGVTLLLPALGLLALMRRRA